MIQKFTQSFKIEDQQIANDTHTEMDLMNIISNIRRLCFLQQVVVFG